MDKKACSNSLDFLAKMLFTSFKDETTFKTASKITERLDIPQTQVTSNKVWQPIAHDQCFQRLLHVEI